MVFIPNSSFVPHIILQFVLQDG